MVGQIVDKAFRVANLLKRPLKDPLFTQREVLSQLMIKSQHTAFGIHHRFSSILYGDISSKILGIQFLSLITTRFLMNGGTGF